MVDISKSSDDPDKDLDYSKGLDYKDNLDTQQSQDEDVEDDILILQQGIQVCTKVVILDYYIQTNNQISPLYIICII